MGRPVLAISLLLTLPAALAAELPRYQATTLGTVVDVADSVFASGIDTNGTVVGHADTRFGERAFIWSPTDGLHELPGPGNGPPRSRAHAINEHSQVTGSIGTGIPGAPERAFIWDAEQGLRELGDLEAGEGSARGEDVNDRGTVVGTASWQGGKRAFLWNDRDGMRDIGREVTEDGDTQALAINNRDHVAGYQIVDGRRRAFVLAPGRGVDRIGDRTGTGVARAVNDAGAVAGRLDDQAFMRLPIGDMRLLGYLDRTRPYSDAHGVNASGVVVGRSDTEDGMRAFVWTAEHGMLRLDSLIADNDSLTLYAATAINDAGQIAAYGMDGDSGRSRAVRLDPLD